MLPPEDGPGRAGTLQRSEQRTGWGRAYRDGRLVCGRVHVTLGHDVRLGLTQRERHHVRLRFHEPLDDEIRAELAQLARRRGATARRIADSAREIAIVLDGPRGGCVRISGRLQPPQVRHGRLRDIEFDLRDLRWTP